MFRWLGAALTKSIDMAAKWTELGTTEPDLTKFRPVYAAKDFLDVIAALKNTNQVNCADPSVFSCYWGVVQVPLPVKDLRQLQVGTSDVQIDLQSEWFTIPA